MFFFTIVYRTHPGNHTHLTIFSCTYLTTNAYIFFELMKSTIPWWIKGKYILVTIKFLHAPLYINYIFIYVRLRRIIFTTVPYGDVWLKKKSTDTETYQILTDISGHDGSMITRRWLASYLTMLLWNDYINHTYSSLVRFVENTFALV